MSRPSLRLAAPAVLALTSVLGLAACTDKADSSASSTGAAAGGPIVVNATDTTCELSASTANAGTVTFEVSNAGTKVNEFYVYAEGDRIISEVENITPGLKRELKVEITEPGTFTTACKPGMVGDGIRAPFTVTGTAVAGSADEKVAKAIADYKAFVATQSRRAARRGPRSSSPPSRPATWPRPRSSTRRPASRGRRIEPVAESFGDLDPRIDGREDVIEEGMKFTGYHRLEKDLWVSGLQSDSSAIADQLLADVKEIAAKSKTVEPDGADHLQRRQGAARRGRDRQDHGRGGALLAHRPLGLPRQPPGLAGRRSRRFAPSSPSVTPPCRRPSTPASASSTSCSSRTACLARFVSYTDLTEADLKALTVSLDALSEEVSKVPGVVEAK